ncbi:helix-turn-helix domain-containing protein [Haloarculaceae archaeon H-GB2-1]|nr:helix-turn-helix domain-containing protein [Haloarculaceae archaeon H-GB1-1]MEA5387666.1 helix-turn-helix domain-containing protein [Haloarculaceae archaeon H-GB11]MEA5409151.1 helix-turn-helix domain-containing protein [Haloarculaceae archaeon H-GB2-1]
MSLIAEFSIASSKLMLSPTFDEIPNVELEVVNEVAIDHQCPVIFTWATCDDAEAFESAMADDETVADFHRFSEPGDHAYYRIAASSETDVTVYPTWIALGAEQLGERYVDGEWHVELRCPDHETLRAFREWCRDNDIAFDLQTVYPSEPRMGTTLSDEQREVLRVALARGFFEIPRAASMAELAEELNISKQAVSERLRRAHEALARKHLS